MHEQDKKWVTEQLKKLPNPLMRQSTLIKYNESFKQAHECEQLSHRKDGKARSYANNKLRIYVKKIQEKTQLYALTPLHNDN